MSTAEAERLGRRAAAEPELAEALWKEAKATRSALFRRGEPGGTVNLITKRPRFEQGGYVRGTIGSWDQFRSAFLQRRHRRRSDHRLHDQW